MAIGRSNISQQVTKPPYKKKKKKKIKKVAKRKAK
jgi:hypothetical protein